MWLSFPSRGAAAPLEAATGGLGEGDFIDEVLSCREHIVTLSLLDQRWINTKF